jgi:hypothetical protein
MHRILSALVFLLLVQSSGAQDIESAIRRHADRFQPERVYMHYDKAVYAAGETVWFKAYLVEGAFPADSARTFYIDWIDAKGTVLKHDVWPVVDATTTGHFDIPGDFKGNAIYVKAYTQWMLNFDSSFHYSKTIRLLNRSEGGQQKMEAPIPSIQFFPEGGDAVTGIMNNFAFKANDQYGRPVKVSGYITDAKGTQVQNFISAHDGMGMFSFFPQAGTSYTAKWKDEKGVERTNQLPPVKPSGIIMKVTLGADRRVISLTGTPGLPETLKQVHIVGTMNGRMAFKTSASINEGVTVQKAVPVQNLPSGILMITVLDVNWNPIAERITFINNNDYAFQTQMKVEHWGTSKRGKNEILITVPDSLVASLSISVTDSDIQRDSSNIITELMLTGHLKGEIYRPAYYFSSNHDSVQKHLDLVMLTHGWRRFQWEAVVKGKDPEFRYRRDTAYLTLSGQLYGIGKKVVSPTDHIILLIKEKDSSMKMNILPIAPDGSFNDPNIAFFGDVKIHHQLKANALRFAEVRYMTNRFPAPNYANAAKSFPRIPVRDTFGFFRQNNLAAESLRLQQLRNSRVMETVTVRATTRSHLQQLEDKYARGLFSGGDAKQFDLVNEPSYGYMNIFQFLQGRVAGLQVNTNSTATQLSWRGSEPSLFLDEMQVEVETISMIPVSDIAYVKVFNPPFLGGRGGSGGGIAIYTRKGGDVVSTSGKGLSENIVSGYSPMRQFYSPDYSRIDPRHEEKDLRTTLYWNPLLQFDPKNRSVLVRFYNNDVSKSFRVVIQGMTRDGVLTQLEEIME